MTTAIDRGRADVVLLDETIGADLERMVERFADREALVIEHQGVRQTWVEFHATVGDVAKGLIARRTGRGDRVAMWSPNSAEWVYVQYATALIGRFR